jgi:hypothetical protein
LAKVTPPMKKPLVYYAGLILTIIGLIGIISQSGIAWTRYLVFGSGIALLIIAFLGRRRN